MTHQQPSVTFDNEAYPEDLRGAEQTCVGTRRARAGLADSPDPLPPFPGVGVALSGGGIRSATFCLGVFRALARADLVRRIDFLSTVSGGGYFGAFLGGLFTPRGSERGHGKAAQPPSDVPGDVTKQLLDLHSAPVAWLRENGRYMSPNGSGDTLLMVAVILRNLIAVQLVVVTALVTLMSGVIVVGNWYTGLSWTLSGLVPQLASLLALSPWFAAPIVTLAVFVVPLGAAFWFTQKGWPWTPWRSGLTPFSTVGMLLAAVVATRNIGWSLLIGAEVLLAVCWWLLAHRRALRVSTEQITGVDGGVTWVERNLLSRWMSNTLWAAVALTMLSVVDWAGESLTINTPEWVITGLISAGSALVGASGAAQALRSLLGMLGKGKRLALPTRLVASVLALVAIGVVVVSASALAHFVDNWVEWPGSLLWLFAGSAVLAFAFSRTIPFLNLSSHEVLYGARLTRAYLGASNPRRQDATAISETIAGDAISMSEYAPYERGGPLHLINVTLNETVSGKSQIEQRDRKGLNMAVGPAGVSVGRRHHAIWEPLDRRTSLRAAASVNSQLGEFRIFPETDDSFTPERLDLGEWVSVSGAAFTTGLGSRTSLATSLLLGLANVRLGYWWDSGVDPGDRHAPKGNKAYGPAETRSGKIVRKLSDAVPVYAYLFDELLARFHGPARRRWYLSDGGHSENTAAYELIRRRVPFIIVCDDGCDPTFAFEDLANLVRRVRTDFNAEVAFYTRQQLAELLPVTLLEHFGVPADFAASGRHRPPHALLAGIFYDDVNRLKPEPDSVMLILKPAVSGDEPLDVLEYKRAHPAFPHESTIDQYFDEAQWESYRRLGEHIASAVFDATATGAWAPKDLVKPPRTRSPWPRTRPVAHDREVFEPSPAYTEMPPVSRP